VGVLTVLGVVFAWWSWKQGAYFDSVFYPGAIALFALLALLLVYAPFGGRVSGPAGLALISLVGLGALMTLSSLWSPTPAAAVRYGEHIFLYAAVFGIGLWVAHLLGRRMLLALAPVAIAGAVVGLAVLAVLMTGTDVTWYLHGDATLRLPIGYRNANAAFFLICLWPLLALAAESDWRWELRALAVAAGTVLFELAFLAQSRGSVPAVIVAALVYLALSRNRLRAAAMLALVVLPALPALPTLLDVFQYGKADPGVVPLLRDAANAIGITAVVSFVLAAYVLGRVAPGLVLRDRTRTAISRLLGIVALLLVVVGSLVFVTRHGGPVGFVDQRLKEFNRVGYPNLQGQGIRYGANVGSNRHDFWRVAVDEGLAHPVLGGGGGSFQSAYLEHRRSGETPEDPHSVEALIFSELGFPGILLLLAFLGAATLAALRARRLGPAAAGLVAGALAGAAQWLTQASFDWFWNYPGVTAPAIFLLGAATAPGLLDPSATRAGRIRGFGVAALLGLSLLAVPLYLSGRYTQRGLSETAANPHGAIADLERAAELNPLDAEPLITKGTIESGLGEESLALQTLREAAEREPDNYAIYYYLARELADSDPALAAQELQKARALNPRDPTVAALQRELDAATRR
jgi:O-antigen ligase